MNTLAGDKEARYTTGQIFGDYLLMLIFPVILSVWYYSTAALSVIAVCLVTSFVCDFIGSIIICKQYYLADFSSICTGLMIAMMMPAGIKLYVPVMACGFAVLVLKIPFGGGMRTPFVPAAAGFAFAAICFKNMVFDYTVGREYMTTVSLGSLLSNGSALRITGLNVLDILTGNIYGPMGSGCILVFIGCIIFLFIRRRSALLSTLGFIVSCVVFALIFPRSNGYSAASPVLELSAGSLMFASVFLVTDYATLPTHTPNKIVYGVFCGIITMTMRYLGAFEEPVCFAVLLSNAFSPLLNIVTDRFISFVSKGKKGEEVTADEQRA